MLSTAIFAAVFIGLLFATFTLWALFLRLGLRWAKVPDVRLRPVLVATTIVITLQVILNVLSIYLSSSSDTRFVLYDVIHISAITAVSCVAISYIFKIRLLRAFQAWLPTLLASATTFAFTQLVLIPFLFEAFVVPTNAMAPTLLGEHWKSDCPTCGQSRYCSPRDLRSAARFAPRMICDNFHVTNAPDVDKTLFSGDRFMVAKFLSPQRWDIIAFHFPEDPAILYVKRLVGLPGEEIQIHDGSVWVDGVEQVPPDSLGAIQYLSEIPNGSGPEAWGSANRPALLGKDEYFVLGDFSEFSLDSRFWSRGAPGHNPYAVPESYLRGVVTHTFWPLHRWHIHR